MKKSLIAIVLMSLMVSLAHADGWHGGGGWRGGGGEGWRGGGEGWRGGGEGWRGGWGDDDEGGGLGLMLGLGMMGGMMMQSAPVYAQPAPVYVQPAPVYVQQAPVYVQPPPAYNQPAYQQPPAPRGHVTYGPTTYYNGYGPH